MREAKSRGIRVTAEVTPHHLMLTHEAVLGYDTLGQKLLTSEPRAISGSMGWMNQWAQEFGVKVNEAFKEEMKKRNKPI